MEITPNGSIFTNADLSYCHNQSSPNDYSSESIVFWLEGVVLTFIGLLGIFGNILTILVLKKLGKLQSNVFNQLIVIICIFDSLFAGFSILEYGFKKGFKLLTYTSPIYVNIWPKVIYPLHNVTYSVSLFMTLAIAFERYIAVCHPFIVGKDRGLNHSASIRGAHLLRQAERNHSNGTSHNTSSPIVRKRTLYYMVPAISVAIMINVPKFMEFRSVDKMNMTTIEPTELRLDPEYELYYINWARTIVNAFLPFVTLAFFNGQIIYSIKMSKNISSNRATSLNKREANLTRILILMVFCFLFCNLGKFVLNLYDLAIGFDRIKTCTSNGMTFHPPIWVVTLLSMNHVLLTMNASANLLLFTCSGTQFRTTLLAMLHLGHRSSNHRSSPVSLCSRRRTSGIELDELTCVSHNGASPSPASKNPRHLQIMVRRNVPSKGFSSPRRGETVADHLNCSEEEKKSLVVYQVGPMSVSKHEPKSQTTFL